MKKEVKEKKFIEKAEKKYNYKYDYSKVDYVDTVTPVCIICPEHGEFWQKPSMHLNSKHGCPICGRNSTSNNNRLTTEEFVDKARKIHGEKYNYSKTEYKDYFTKVCIICPEHGEFYQTPCQHFRGAGCQKCGEIQPLKKEEFILKARQIHGWKYDYSKVEYVNARTKVCIICPEHGEFWQKPCNHTVNKEGCPICYKENKIKNNELKFIQKAKKIHGDKYDYSKVNYINCDTKVCIICPEHGEFYQTPEKHIQGRGCQKCSKTFKKYTHDSCYDTACKYKTFYEFRKYDYGTYVYAKKSGWLDEYNWIEEVQYEDMKSQTVYVYEFSDNSAYVGLTNNIERRDLQHRNKEINDGVLKHSIEHNIEIPKPKILKECLTRKESQIEEKRYIELYRKNGWNLLNKIKGGSLGFVYTKNKWTKEDIIKEAKKYKNQEEMRKYSRTWYNRMIRAKLTKECFPNGRFLDNINMKNPYEYTNDFLMEMKQKYPLKQDLRKNEHRVYTWLWKHNRLNEFYP